MTRARPVTIPGNSASETSHKDDKIAGPAILSYYPLNQNGRVMKRSALEWHGGNHASFMASISVAY
jgi:hypothetical protein